MISDAHEVLKAAITRVLGATWQRCRVHWTRNALAYVPKGQHTTVAAALRQGFQQPDHAAARTALLYIAEMMRARWPKLAAFIIDSEADVLAYMTFPSQHRTKLHSTNSFWPPQQGGQAAGRCRRHLPERGLDRPPHRRVLLKAKDDWQLQHRYMQTEGMAELNTGPADDHLLEATPRAA